MKAEFEWRKYEEVIKWKKSKAGNKIRGSIKIHIYFCAIFDEDIVSAAIILFAFIYLLMFDEVSINYLSDRAGFQSVLLKFIENFLFLV